MNQTLYMITIEHFNLLKQKLSASHTELVAVSKFKSVANIRKIYDMGQRDFGENYVQELAEKQNQLPNDIRWHFIGHLQSNKVKYIAAFVHLIHGVDSFKLLKEINKQAALHSRSIHCLLQIHIAEEETKFGLDEKECLELLEYYTAQKRDLQNTCIRGLMGMASFSSDEQKVKAEFHNLRNLFGIVAQNYFLGDDSFDTLSMGMSGDYEWAIEEGSNLVRIGSLIFGNRK